MQTTVDKYIESLRKEQDGYRRKIEYLDHAIETAQKTKEFTLGSESELGRAYSESKVLTINAERRIEIIQDLKSRLGRIGTNNSELARSFVDVLRIGETYTHKMFAEYAQETRPDDATPLKTLTSTIHTISKQLINDKKVKIVEEGGGAGMETVYQKIGK